MRAVLLVVLSAAACSDESPSTAPATAPTSPPPANAEACITDGLGEIHFAKELDWSCTERESCRAECERGVRDACVMYAYGLQREDSDQEATAVFARACKLGASNGCVNYGAALWTDGRSRCAHRLFERACYAYDPLGCGMIGRMMANRAKTPERREAARRYLDRVCSSMGNMTCRMYAFHLENGDLGATADPKTIEALMDRACKTGDEDACDSASASETFH